VKADAEILLQAWGAWNRGHPSLHISGMSIIAQLMLEGAGASHSTVRGEPAMSKIIEITERCVLTMPKTLQRPVKHRYIGQEPDTIAAKKLRLTLREYEERINTAIHFLENYLVEN